MSNDSSILLGIRTVGSSISLVASLAIVGFFLRVPKPKRVTVFWTCVLGMAISDVGVSLSYLFVWFHADHAACVWDALAEQFFTWASIAWIACVAHWMWRCICLASPLTLAGRRTLIVRYHLISWGSSVLLLCLPFVDGFDADGLPSSYGYDGIWCWLRTGSPQHWVITMYYGPMWVTEVYIVYCVLTCRNRLASATQSLRTNAQRSSTTSQTLRMQKKLYWRLSGYPLLLILAWGPASVRRVWQTVAPGSLESLGLATWAAGIQITFSSLAGLFNFFFFVATMSVREQHGSGQMAEHLPEDGSNPAYSCEGSARRDSSRGHPAGGSLRSLRSSDAMLLELVSPRTASQSSGGDGTIPPLRHVPEDSSTTTALLSLEMLVEETDAGQLLRLSPRRSLSPTAATGSAARHEEPVTCLVTTTPSSAIWMANSI